jgi:formamidopyrimidine-DNA glycosylase
MPEGPECRRVYEGISEFSQNKTVTDFEVLGGRFLKRAPDLEVKTSVPTRVTGCGVKGKFIWLEFSDETCLWITLGMSGYWSTDLKPHSHFRIGFKDGCSLYFVDQRRFGTLKFTKLEELPKKLASLGLDMLNDQTASMYDFVRKIESSKAQKKTVAEALMDQSLFAGVGNYIKCEMLYRCRVSPYRRVSDLTQDEICQLWNWGKLIMSASYQQGGASIRNYRQVNGEAGNFTFEFEVYAQKKDPLGNDVVREETPDGRTTHWVPSLQS